MPLKLGPDASNGPDQHDAFQAKIHHSAALVDQLSDPGEG